MLKVFTAFIAHNGVGVLALGQKQKAGLAPVFHRRESRLQCAKRRFATGLVAVKAEHDFWDVAEQAFQMRLAGRRAEGGDRVGDAKLGERNHIHVAFDHDNTLEAALGLAGLIKAVKFA